jgi:hypothetical protein
MRFFILSIGLVFGLWLWRTSGISTMLYYFIFVGLILFVLEAVFDFGNALVQAWDRMRDRQYVIVRHPDPTRPDDPEGYPAIIEVDRHNR